MNTAAESTSRDLHFPAGIPGFPHLRSVTLTPLEEADASGVYADLSGDAGEGMSVSFLAARAGAFFADYIFEIDDATAATLQAEVTTPDVWVVLTATEAGVVANLRAPIVVNPTSGVAAQVVLDERFPLSRALV